MNPRYWMRWHELLDRHEEGGLSPAETIEYEKMAKAAKALDESEARIASRALDRLDKRHDRVLASIRRTADAVVAAADVTASIRAAGKPE